MASALRPSCAQRCPAPVGETGAPSAHAHAKRVRRRRARGGAHAPGTPPRPGRAPQAPARAPARAPAVEAARRGSGRSRAPTWHPTELLEPLWPLGPKRPAWSLSARPAPAPALHLLAPSPRRRTALGRPRGACPALRPPRELRHLHPHLGRRVPRGVDQRRRLRARPRRDRVPALPAPPRPAAAASKRARQPRRCPRAACVGLRESGHVDCSNRCTAPSDPSSPGSAAYLPRLAKRPPPAPRSSRFARARASACAQPRLLSPTRSSQYKAARDCCPCTKTNARTDSSRNCCPCTKTNARRPASRARGRGGRDSPRSRPPWPRIRARTGGRAALRRAARRRRLSRAAGAAARSQRRAGALVSCVGQASARRRRGNSLSAGRRAGGRTHRPRPSRCSPPPPPGTAGPHGPAQARLRMRRPRRAGPGAARAQRSAPTPRAARAARTPGAMMDGAAPRGQGGGGRARLPRG